MLQLQESERQTVHRKPRQCLFCLEYSSSLLNLFSHMFKVHCFNIGLLDNLVMVEDFLATLDSLLMQNICIYCHNVFRSASCLRKHMKNKRHYKIDPKNHQYDKYYIANYLKNAGKKDDNDAIDVEKEGEMQDEEDDWDDLNEELDLRTSCIFCSEVFEKPDHVFSAHLMEAHKFDLEELRKDYDFYDYIKIVTFLRYHFKELQCGFCKEKFSIEEDLIEHLRTEEHCKIPSRQEWNQPEYLFPVFDDDPLLFDFGEDESVNND